jgi:shikimate kinase
MTHSDQKSIFLIGYRGTGKSAVARELAERLGCEWVDVDDWIERQAGKTITRIFSEDGEPAFRELEARAVEAISHEGQSVVALGGGAVLREENRKAISGAQAVVWLVASVDTIQERLAADAATASRRPNLTAAGGREEVEALLAQREPLYRQCATLIVDTEGKTAGDVADEIAANL